MKRTLTLLLGVMLFGSILQAQSTFDKVLFDFDLEPSNSYGVHGVAVAPDGNVWVVMFGAMTGDTIFTPAGDTLDMRPIYVLDPTTGDHVSFSPIRFLEWDDGTIDTLVNSSRGIEVDNDGNLLITGPLGSNSIVRIDYTNGKPLGSFVAPNTGSMTEAVQSPADGNIYATHVVPSGKPIYLIDTDLNFISNAVDSFFNINRTLEVSADGMDLYTGSIYNGVGIRHFHSDAPGLTPFEAVSDFGNWTNVQGVDTVYETINLWPSCLDFGPDGLLWAGMLDDGESNGHGKGSQWYGFDVENGALVRTLGTPMGDKNAGGFFRPRGAAWSPDGTKMYLADFNYNNVVVYNYEAWVKPDSIDLSVTYQADMELEILKGSFDPASDTVEVRGAFFGWGSEAPDMTPNAINPNVYEHTATQRATVGDNLPNYKFYYTVGNWEGGSDKTYQITQEDYDAGFAVVARPFNDATLDDVVNQDVTILFTVNTAGAISAINNTAFTTVNTVHITGATQPFMWPSGGWPDEEIDRMIPLFDDGTNGDETAADGIFSTNVTFPAYTILRFAYKYGINYGDAANNQGGNDNENGVGADHFIELTADLVTAKVENVFGEMGDHPLVDMVTGVEELDQLPTGYELSQNYPNPFNPSTQIKFQLNGQEDVSLKIYNLLGQEVATLLNETMSAGVYEVSFDASQLSSGMYIYTISAGEFYSSKKMTLLK